MDLIFEITKRSSRSLKVLIYLITTIIVIFIIVSYKKRTSSSLSSSFCHGRCGGFACRYVLFSLLGVQDVFRSRTNFFFEFYPNTHYSVFNLIVHFPFYEHFWGVTTNDTSLMIIAVQIIKFTVIVIIYHLHWPITWSDYDRSTGRTKHISQDTFLWVCLKVVGGLP